MKTIKLTTENIIELVPLIGLGMTRDGLHVGKYLTVVRAYQFLFIRFIKVTVSVVLGDCDTDQIDEILDNDETNS